MNPVQPSDDPETDGLRKDVSSDQTPDVEEYHFGCIACPTEFSEITVQDLSQAYPEEPVEEEEWDPGESLVINFYSNLAEQVEWEERLKQRLEISHCCASCTYFCREYRAPIPCAVHPYGMGVDATAQNQCCNWDLVDVSWALVALEQSLINDLMTVGKQWKILRLIFRYAQSVEALVRVDNKLHRWTVRYWTAPEDSFTKRIVVRYGGKCWKNLGDREAYIVWINPDPA